MIFNKYIIILINISIMCLLYGTQVGQCVVEVKSDCTRVIGNINRTYVHQVTNDNNILYTIPLNPAMFRDPFGVTLRLEAWVDEERMDYSICPLLFTIAQAQEIMTFKLPYVFKMKPSNVSIVDKYYSAARTLCVPEEYSQQARNVTIRVSTCSSKPIWFRFKLAVLFERLIADGKPITLNVSPTTPHYFKYTFSEPDVRIIRIVVSSEDNKCATVSVQGPYCPVYDQESNVAFDGFWQTMSTKAALTISRRDFPTGFVVVIVLHKDDSHCSEANPRPMFVPDNTNGKLMSQRSKTVELYLRNERTVSAGVFFSAMIIPVIASLALVIITCIFFQNRHNWLSRMATDAFIKTPTNRNGRGGHEARILLEGEPNSSLNMYSSHINNGRDHDSEMEMSDLSMRFGKLNTNTNNSSIWRWKSTIHIAALQRKEHREVMKDSNRFYWTIIIVSIFYTIPVYQLILHYLRVVNKTGEFDICYYNFLCSHRLWIFTDFNHFWSNISYVLFGVAFNFIVGRRERNLRLAKVGDEDKLENGNIQFESAVPQCLVQCCCAPIIPGRVDHGIPLHFGVFYAMGLALVMEGVLSAAYHLCPNQSNFQFDTCFMYVIAVLSILKVYQFRHPVHIGANQTFAILAAFAFISVIGLVLEIYDGGSLVSIFRWTFIGVQFVAMALISVHYYAVGHIKDPRGGNLTGWSMYAHLNQLPHTVQLDRLVLPIISLSMSMGVVIYCELGGIHFATYLLYTLIANVLASCIYYIAIMKPLHGEFKNWTWVQPTLYFVASGVLGTIAIQYFLNALTAWEVSPSASRAVNAECAKSWFSFFPFYDNHDIWHFFSAGGLFCAFMGLLIVDDDLLTTPQNKIPIF